MIVRAMVLGSWMVHSSILSRSLKSLDVMLEREKGITKVVGSLKAEEEVVEITEEEIKEEYGTKEEGSSEGRG